MDYKMVIVMRKDLALSEGKAIVQGAHAAVSAAREAKKSNPKWHKLWLEEGQKKVVVKVETLDDLLDIERLAKAKGLPRHLVQDAGLTEVPPGTVTCLGIGPAPNNLMDPVTGSLSLV